MSESGKRPYCQHCLYPQSVCICSAISLIDNKTRVTVLQHPSETSVAKNTVRLMRLSLQHLEVVVGESATDFDKVKSDCLNAKQTTALLYPNEHSQPLESAPSLQNITSVILIDGTWRKAYKIWQLNPWLQELNNFHFTHAPASSYQRVANQTDSLSTLEATAYALSIIEGNSYRALTELQHARQAKGF